MMLLVLVYLVAGVLAGEKLQLWLMSLPEWIGYPLYRGLIFVRDFNPFGADATYVSRSRSNFTSGFS